MYPTHLRRIGAGLAAVAVVAAGSAVAPANAHGHGNDHHASPVGTGPSTTVDPYVLPIADGVRIRSLLTVNDQPAGNGTPMVGVPDGLGAFKRGKDLVLYMNQEFQAAQGAVHGHGQKGAFVTRNVIDRHTGAVKATTDLIQTVKYWDYTTGAYAAAPTAPFSAAFARFCSGSLSAPGQLRSGNAGYPGQIYFANEENGDNGRLFGVTEDGTAAQLPRLGLFSWENTLLADTRSAATVVVGNEDGGSGQLRVYIGTKKSSGTPVDQAGLTNGSVYVVDATNPAVTTDAEFRTTYATGASAPATIKPIDWTASGADQNIQAAAQGLSLNRIEDGGFDPSHPNDYYFITTEGGDTTSVENDPVTGTPVTRDGGGLWRLRFNDVRDPSKGMTLTLLLDGSQAPYLNKPDNMTVDGQGHLMIQEDPGGNAHLARVLAYDLRTGRIAELAEFDPAHFAPGATVAPTTIDEESSGIIDVADLLGKGAFLFDAQVHTSTGLSEPTTQVEHGQLLRMDVDWNDIFGHGHGLGRHQHRG